jgi:enamine deaminase RidA (YjgF/YER057c/UK114 family)
MAIVAPVTQARNPASIHAPLAGYSHQIELRGQERLLVLSGQVGMATDGRIPDDPAEQLELAMDNVLRNLDAAAMGVGDLVKLTFYLVAPIDADRRRAVLADRLGGHEPCMTLIHVAGLAAPAIKVELDAWASAEDGADPG